MRQCLVCSHLNTSLSVYCQQCQNQLPTRNLDLFDGIKAFVLSSLLTALLYILVLPQPIFWFLQPILDNLVSQVIVFFSLWTLFLMMFRFKQYRFQLKKLQHFYDAKVINLFEGGIDTVNSVEKLEALTQLLSHETKGNVASSLIYQKVRRIFSHLRNIPKKEQIHQILDYQSNVNFNRVDNSYVLVNTLIWAIPILGFIGTVLGVGEAIGEFSSFLQTVDSSQINTQIRSALGGVTNGLSTAFHTTFLGLFFAIPLMMLAAMTRRAEEELQLQVEEYCLEHVIPYLQIQEVSTHFQPVDEQLAKICHFSKRWQEEMELCLETLKHYSEGVQNQVSGLQPLLKEFSASLYPGGQKEVKASHHNTLTNANHASVEEKEAS